MRLYVVFILLLILHATDSSGQFRNRRQKQWPKTEGELMAKLLHSLQNKDTAEYYSLFPPFDTLWSMTMHNPDKSPEVQKELAHLKEHPQVLIEFDPLYNKDIIGNFSRILAKGEDSGMQWGSTIMARYELHKQGPSRVLEGYDQIAPERFSGYMFVTDAFNRIIFCISVAEVQKIRGQFFGGQLVNVLEAKTVDQFRMKEEKERAYFEWVAEHPDSVATDTVSHVDSVSKTDTSAVASNPLSILRDEDGDEDGLRREVIDRRYYEGLMDNEIPISLYIRYMKVYPGKPPQYDGLYKLGKNRRYLKLEITRNKDGKWIIEDETAVGTMELTLTARTYTGAWINAEDNGFDVVIRQTGTPKGKIELLDQILDRGASSRVDESQFEEETKEGDNTTDKKDEPKKEDAKKEEKKKDKGDKEKKDKREKKKKRKERETKKTTKD